MPEKVLSYLDMVPEKSTLPWPKTAAKPTHKKKQKLIKKRRSGCFTFICSSNQRTKIQKLFLNFSPYTINPLTFAKNYGNKNPIGRADATHYHC